MGGSTCRHQVYAAIRWQMLIVIQESVTAQSDIDNPKLSVQFSGVHIIERRQNTPNKSLFGNVQPYFLLF